MKVRIATLPEGEDPDSFISKNGRDEFLRIIDAAKDLFEYKLDLLVEKLGVRDISGIVDEMLPTIAKVESAVIQSDYLRKLAERLGVHEASLRYEMGKVKPDYSYHYAKEGETDRTSNNYRASEVHLLGLAMMDEGKFKRIESELGLDQIRDRDVRKVMDMVGEVFASGMKEVSPGKLLSRLEEDERAKEAAVQALAKADITEDPERAFSDCMFCIRKENREEELKSLTERLKKAQDKGNDTEMKELLVRINNIHKEKVA